MGDGQAEQTYREVMLKDPPAAASPLGAANLDFVFGEVWTRPGLSRRERRWVTLTCVAAADSPQPIEDHVYAALKSGDIEFEAMLEFILQFAVYCGWPKAAHCEGAINRQWARVQKERGEEPTPWPVYTNDTLGISDFEGRLVPRRPGVRRREPDAGAKAAVAVPSRRHPQLRVRPRLAAAGDLTSRASHHHLRCLRGQRLADTPQDARRCRDPLRGRPQGGHGRDRPAVLRLLRLRQG